MADFTVRSESVDVEQVMQRIRARIREKRGVDYTEDEVRELAGVKLEKFLDPNLVRSDLIEHYRRRRPTGPPPLDPVNLPAYEFEADTIYTSSRGVAGRLIAAIRRLLNPVLKLFFNPNPVVQTLHLQARINRDLEKRFTDIHHWLGLREQVDALNYEVLNNIVVELTRLGIEVKNLRMRVESFGSRLDFSERRARALEGVVQYRPEQPPPESPGETTGAGPEGPGRSRRRRRRGRQRRPGGPGPGAGGIEPSSSAQREGSSSDTRPEPGAPEPPTAPERDSSPDPTEQ